MGVRKHFGFSSPDIEFYFSANKGGRLNSIKEVASGGELARLTLVIKSLVAAKIPLPTLIFDEIDKMPEGMIDGIKPFIDHHENETHR